MFYAIYLLGIIFWILRGIGGGFGNLIPFMDGFTFMFVLFPCVLLLWPRLPVCLWQEGCAPRLIRRKLSCSENGACHLGRLWIPRFYTWDVCQHPLCRGFLFHRFAGLDHPGSAGVDDIALISVTDLEHPAAALLHAEKISPSEEAFLSC